MNNRLPPDFTKGEWAYRGWPHAKVDVVVFPSGLVMSQDPPLSPVPHDASGAHGDERDFDLIPYNEPLVRYAVILSDGVTHMFLSIERALMFSRGYPCARIARLIEDEDFDPDPPVEI